MTLEQKQKTRARARELYRAMTPEQRERTNWLHRNVSPGKRQERNARTREWYANRAPGQREISNARLRKRRKECPLTPEQRQKKNARVCERYAAMTPGQHARHLKKKREQVANARPEQQACRLKKSREWHARRTPGQREEMAKRHRERTCRQFGMNERRIAVFLKAAASDPCDICGDFPRPGKAHCIDHDHKLGKTLIAIRGILCAPCNNMLGLAKDDLSLLGRDGKLGIYLIEAQRRQAAGQLERRLELG